MAREYLLKRGFLILYQNWRYRHWEVDFIASQNNILHFIEVKTRRTQKFGYPEEDVTKKKMENLINASAEFLYLNPEWKLIQFDVLSITLLANREPEYFFIEDIYIS